MNRRTTAQFICCPYGTNWNFQFNLYHIKPYCLVTTGDNSAADGNDSGTHLGLCVLVLYKIQCTFADLKLYRYLSDIYTYICILAEVDRITWQSVCRW